MDTILYLNITKIKDVFVLGKICAKDSKNRDLGNNYRKNSLDCLFKRDVSQFFNICLIPACKDNLNQKTSKVFGILMLYKYSKRLQKDGMLEHRRGGGQTLRAKRKEQRGKNKEERTKRKEQRTKTFRACLPQVGSTFNAKH